MKIILLTHERELDKKTNTGVLVRHTLGDDAQLIVWRRKEPDKCLLDLLERKEAALLFPPKDPAEHLVSELSVSNSEETLLDSSTITRYEWYVILDATWQQAAKMYRQSTYLRNADKVYIEAGSASVFTRRRNQREGGLCTAECALALLNLSNSVESFQVLKQSFEQFNRL